MTDNSKSGRFSDRVCRALERTRYRIAVTQEDLEAVFRLRYEAYMREGGIAPNATQLFSDSFDELGNVFIVAMEIDGELASSIRLHVADAQSVTMPSAGVFGDVLASKIASGKVIVDPTRHVANLALSRRFPELPYLTVRSAWMAGAYFAADHILAAVRGEHKTFYKRTFGHDEWSDERPYPLLTKPIVCLGLDFPGRRAAVEAKYPFYKSSPRERAALFARSSSDEALRMKAPVELSQHRSADACS